MALSTGPSSPSYGSALNWLELGPPPPEVGEWQVQRRKLVLSVGAPLGGVTFGILAGFVSNALWPITGTFTWDLPLFLAVAGPVAVGEFFFLRWFVPWLARLSQLTVRRVAIADERLEVDLTTGRRVTWPLKHVEVSKEPVAGGWYIVSRPAGKTREVFWVPPMVASAIRAALPP